MPLLYILCCNKNQATYEEIFRNILRLEPDIKPTNIMIDFERASINAIVTFFDSSQLNGCFFHFTQSVWRQIQSAGLQSKYSSDSSFAHNFRMVLALAFVPPEDVVEAFEQITSTEFWLDNEESEFNDEKQAFLNYFEATYIGKSGRNCRSQRKRPLFAIDLWNMYGLTLVGIPRTNNNVEGWHNRINSLGSWLHPKIFKFISDMMKEQKIVDLKVIQINAGEKPEKRARKYERLDERLLHLVESYNENSGTTQPRDILDFLNNIAHNICF